MVKNTFSFYRRLVKTGLKQSFALKGAFFCRMIFMIFNNLMMLLAWGLMFKKFHTINGWDFNHFVFMTGLAVSSFSIWPLFFRGTGIYLSRMIENGDLDAYLLQPRQVLPHIACSVSDPSGFGDLITGIILLICSGFLTFNTILIVLFCFICATICFLAINICVSSLPFYINKTSEIGERIFYMFFSISNYPGCIYSGYMKLLFCTIFPVGIISVLPVQLVQNFSWQVFLYLFLFTLFILTTSIFLFYTGLKRYEGSNRFGVHG